MSISFNNATLSLTAFEILSGIAILAITAVGSASGGEKKTIYDFAMKNINGEPVEFSRYKGKVVLMVNVASRCGYTTQYKDLEALYQKYKGKGLVVLGFPANDFGKQEPGSDDEIKAFCEKNYGVTFEMFSKISVKGPDQHPLYGLITSDSKVGGDVKWNFQKYLVNKRGVITHKFLSSTKPMSEELTQAVEEALNE